MDKTPPTLHQLFALLRAFDGRIGMAAEGVSEARTNLASSLYGRQLVAFARAAAQALEEGGEDLFGLPGAAGRLREGGQHVEELGHLCDSLQALHRGALAAWKRARVELADDVTQVCQAADAVQLYPGFDREAKQRAAVACEPLDRLRQERQAGARARYQRTRRQNEDWASLQASQDAERRELEAELQRRELEQRYLTHGGLRPEDRSSPLSTPGAGGAALRRARSRPKVRSLDVAAAPPALPAARRRRRT